MIGAQYLPVSMDDSKSRLCADWLGGSIPSVRSPGTWRRRSLRNQKTWRRCVPEMPFVFSWMCMATLDRVLREDCRHVPCFVWWYLAWMSYNIIFAFTSVPGGPMRQFCQPDAERYLSLPEPMGHDSYMLMFLRRQDHSHFQHDLIVLC